MSDTKRLVLHKLIQTNFKSYAGKVTIGPFHSSFTSVVGPNGSGKSNVIDSLLFVFGFKAKKLRQGKLSDLIHKSINFPDLDSCGVEVVFCEYVGDEFVQGSEFTVSRTVRKLGSKETSAYFIDGRNSTFTEVQNLLIGYGVDLEHKRFLILQGEVESISLMKPKATAGEDGLLEYLEDIIGTTRFGGEIEKATGEYECQVGVYDEALVKFKHAQKECDGLREKSEDALAYVEWENDCSRAKNLVLQMQVHEGRKQAVIVEKRVEESKAELLGLEKSQEEDVLGVKALEVELGQLKGRMKEISVSQQTLIKSLSAVEKSEVELKETSKYLTAKKKKLMKTLADDRHTRSEDLSWISNFQSDLLRTRNELAVLKERLGTEESLLEEIQASLGDKTQHLQTRIEERQGVLAPYQAIINKIEVELSVVKSEIDLLASKRDEGASRLEECLKRVNDVRILMKTRKQDRIDCLMKIEDLETKLIEHRNRQQILSCQLKEEKEECKKIKVRYEDASHAQGSSQSRGKVHTFLNSLKSTLPGICGRLGDLGSIGSKYDIAITTACSQLDFVVVDDVATAQECIRQLKVTGIGRANFICLEKIKAVSKSPIPSGSERLFDLIKTEIKFEKAFYQALGETLVTGTIEEANKLAYGSKRFRVVTVSGEVIDKTGTMAGGGRVMKGGMGGKTVSREEVDELKRELDEKETKVSSLEDDLTGITGKIDSAESCLRELKKEVSRLELDLTSYNEEKKDAKTAFEAAQVACQEDTADSTREAELKVELEKLLEKLIEPKNQADSVQEQIKALQNEIMEVGGVRLRSQHGKVESLNDQIVSIQKKLVKLVAEKTTREKNLEKSSQNIERREEEMLDVEKEIEMIEDKASEIVKSSSTVKSEISSVNDEMETMEEKVSALKSELSEKTGDMNQARSKNVELKAKIAADSATLKSISNNLLKNQSELEGLKLEMTGFEEMDHEILPLETYLDDQLDSMNLKEAIGALEKLKTKFSGNSPNLAVLREYRQKMEVYKERSAIVEKAIKRRDEMKVEYDRLRKERLDKFMEGFNAISLKLKEMYQMITLGGNAELELVDSLDPFSEGVLFSVMPPKKSWKNIANLSGGEKTLSSLALVFALHHFKPTPLYVMDEIDAALDFRNVSIIANYIKQRTRNAQFVIISLRNNMFELADRLVGIYKTDNTSKSISINPNEVEAAVKEEKLSHAVSEIAIAAE